MEHNARSQPLFRYRHRNVLQRTCSPHFHAKYGGQYGVFSLPDLRMTEGKLPRRVISLVLEWAFEQRDELIENWKLSEMKKPLKDIAPLD